MNFTNFDFLTQKEWFYEKRCSPKPIFPRKRRVLQDLEGSESPEFLKERGSARCSNCGNHFWLITEFPQNRQNCPCPNCETPTLSEL